MNLELHFVSLSKDYDDPEEDIVTTLLGVIGYSLQSFRLRPQDYDKTLRHMRAEYLRVKGKVKR